MGTGDLNNWQAVQAEVLRRIHARIWAPGDLIPGEQALAQEFGCARATVNRALQSLSDAGLLERRRKAGTRVALHPVRKATLDIPVIRREIEDLGHAYSYKVLSCEADKPNASLAQMMQLKAQDELIRITSVQFADDVPFVYEDRWLNLTTVPAAAAADFHMVSANEWLVSNAPFSHGDISFSAVNAGPDVAKHLAVSQNTAIFVIDRMTWDVDRSITAVRQYFQAGYRMQTRL
ncbi:MAG: GntR family transcriptional regulator [Roseovarius sp.]